MAETFLGSIRFQHAFTFRPEFPRNMIQAASWRFLAELMFRHPNAFELQTDYYPTGQPMIWAIHKSSQLKVGVVEGSSITVFNPEHRPGCPVCEAIPEEENSRLHTLDLLHAQDLGWPISDLEVCMGMQRQDVARSLQAGSVSAAVIRDMFWHAEKMPLNLNLESPAIWSEDQIFDLLRQFPELPPMLKGVTPYRPDWDRFEEEMRDSLRNIIYVELPQRGENETEKMVFDLDKGFHFSTAGGFPLMDEIKAGGNTSGIALGLLDI